jgi:hypothetical protein
VSEWLLLIHQLPQKPSYLRVRVARRLQSIGAIALKNTVYVLPATEGTLEQMHWTVREIRDSDGDANVCKAQFVDGLSDGDLQQRFNDARDADYEPLLAAARRRDANISDLRERLAAIRAIDYFGAPNGQALEALLDAKSGGPPPAKLDLHGRVWVTRAGIHVDRMASAWLIKRFIDRAAKFRFIAGKPKKGEIAFDMFDADFTHEGDRCTFEVLVHRAALTDKALSAIGEIVHEIDLRDGKFARAETAGVALLVNGIARAHREDHERLRRASELFDELYGAMSPSTSASRRR